MRTVAALGGNALLRRGEPVDAEVQRRNVQVAAAALATLAVDHEVVITHGNGPQVGMLAQQSAALAGVAPYPLDVIGAESEGMIGYLIDQELGNRLPQRTVVTLLTQVVVDAADPAFGHPTKPVGRVYERAEAEVLAAREGWCIAPDGPSWRRVVASPEPVRIVELDAIRILVDAGVIVVCTGGGGIPVIETPAGERHGVAAVIDKDLAAALLAEGVGAQVLLLLTDVDAVYDGWGEPGAQPLRRVRVADLRARSFPPGSMGPKIEAACRFVERTGGVAAIGALADAGVLVAGDAGTLVEP